MSDCIPVEELEALLEDPSDPRHAHLQDCPRCRALLASYGRFLAADPEHADFAAEAELGARLDAAIHIGERPGLLGRLWSGPWLRPALGGAALLLALVLLLPPEEPPPSDPSGLLRQEGAVATELALDARSLADGGYRLTWQRVEGVIEYRVQLFDAERAPLATLPAGGDTTLVVDRPDARYWQLELRRGADAPLFSRLAALPAR